MPLQTTSRRIFLTHPWSSTPDYREFRAAISTVADEMGVMLTYPEDQPLRGLSSEQLIKVLQESDLVIVDVSDWSPNVAFELGVARGLGRPIILVSNSASQKDTPRDILESPLVRYNDYQDLAVKLAGVIRSELGYSSRSEKKSHNQIARAVGDPAASALAQQVIDLLRARDYVGLRELARAERRSFQSQSRSLVRRYANSATAAEFEAEISPQLTRYLALLFPLVDHSAPQLAEEARVIARLAGTRFVEQGYTMWVDMPRWLAWWICNATGAFALSIENDEAVRVLFETVVDAPTLPPPGHRLLGTLMPESSGLAVAEAWMAKRDARYVDPPLLHLAFTLDENGFLGDRYPDFTEEDRGSIRWLADFNLLSCLIAAPRGERMINSWAAVHEGGERLVRRLIRDPFFRRRIGTILSTSPEELLRDLAGWIERALQNGPVPGGFPNSEAQFIAREAGTSSDLL